MSQNTFASICRAVTQEQVLRVKKSKYDNPFETRETTQLALYLDHKYPTLTKQVFDNLNETTQYHNFGVWFTRDAPEKVPEQLQLFFSGAFDMKFCDSDCESSYDEDKAIEQDIEDYGREAVSMLMIQTILASGHAYVLNEYVQREVLRDIASNALALAQYADGCLIALRDKPRYTDKLEKWAKSYDITLHIAEIEDEEDLY